MSSKFEMALRGWWRSTCRSWSTSASSPRCWFLIRGIFFGTFQMTQR
jgi:hypothetical protein